LIRNFSAKLVAVFLRELRSRPDVKGDKSIIGTESDLLDIMFGLVNVHMGMGEDWRERGCLESISDFIFYIVKECIDSSLSAYHCPSSFGHSTKILPARRNQQTKFQGSRWAYIRTESGSEQISVTTIPVVI
jgi:hypothetical protein